MNLPLEFPAEIADAGQLKIVGRSASLSHRSRAKFDGIRMQESNLLSFLRCPDDGSELTVAEAAIIQKLNAAIRAGVLRNEGGRVLDETIDGGLIRKGGDLLYPIVDGIPILLHDEAIPVHQFESAANDRAK